MDKNQSSEIHTSENESAVGAGGRRKFLQKASAGALIATIPAKSVWATGLTNSIVASGHGSDFAGGRMNLHDVYFWTHNASLIPDVKFKRIFGGPALKSYDKTFNKNLKMAEIMTDMKHGAYKYGGPNNINRQLIATYLNAYYSGSYGIFFPVVGLHPKPYQSPEALAHSLYLSATGIGGSPARLADELATLNSTDAVVA